MTGLWIRLRDNGPTVTMARVVITPKGREILEQRDYAAEFFVRSLEDLRREAAAIEHDCEFNDVDLAPAERRENNRAINRSRTLNDIADLRDPSYAHSTLLDDDIRYDYVRCATCGETHQRIDFRGNPHAFFCPNPKEANG